MLDSKREKVKMFTHKGQEIHSPGPGTRGEAWGQLDRGESSRTGSKRKEFHEERRACVKGFKKIVLEAM